MAELAHDQEALGLILVTLSYSKLDALRKRIKITLAVMPFKGVKYTWDQVT